MSCNCGHISCLCGVPCLCDASMCKCLDCVIAVGRVCNMCNKPFYYERLTLRQMREEDVCDCFMVKPRLQGNDGTITTIETNCTNFYKVSPVKHVNEHIQLSEHQIIEQSGHYHVTHIPESLDVQNSDPSSINPSKGTTIATIEQQGQNHTISLSGHQIIEQSGHYHAALIPESLDVQNSDPSSTNPSKSKTIKQQLQNPVIVVSESPNLTNIDISSSNCSKSIILNQPEQNRPLSVPHYSSITNIYSPSMVQSKGIIPEQNLTLYTLEPMNVQKYDFYDLGASQQTPEPTGEMNASTPSFYLTENPMNIESNYPDEENPECSGITLDWLEKLPKLESPIEFNALV